MVEVLPSVSVVIPTRNRSDLLQEVVQAALDEPDALEVVVVDDGSTDNTPRLLERMVATNDGRIVSVRGAGLGGMAARQRGVEAARGDVVLLLDDDVRAEPGLVPGHARHHVGGRRLVVIGYMPVLLPPQRTSDNVATFLYHDEYERHCEMYERDPDSFLLYLWSGNMSLRREDILEAGVANLRYPARYHQDRELGLRLRRAGFRATFDRGLKASHVHRRSLPALLKDARHQGAGRVLLHEMYAEELGAVPADEFTSGLPWPLRRVLPAIAGKPGHQALVSALATLAGLLGRAGWFDVQTQVVRLLRRLEQLRGARLAGQAPQ